MQLGVEKEAHKSCPFKSSASAGTDSQVVGRYTSPREMCTHNCALFDEREQACAFKLIAIRLSQPVRMILQSSGTEGEAGE